jgi:hypothetical protein
VQHSGLRNNTATAPSVAAFVCASGQATDSVVVDYSFLCGGGPGGAGVQSAVFTAHGCRGFACCGPACCSSGILLAVVAPLCVPDLGQLSTIVGAAICCCFGWFCCLFLHRRHAMELPTRVVCACLRRYAAETRAACGLCVCPAATLLPGRVCGRDCSSCTFRIPLNVLLSEVRSAILCFLRPCTCTIHARVWATLCAMAYVVSALLRVWDADMHSSWCLAHKHV